MLAGVMISGLMAGVISLAAALALHAGVAVGALWYVVGGLSGAMAFVQLALVRNGREAG